MTILSNNEIARAIYLVSKDKSQVEQSHIFNGVVRFLFKRRLLSKGKDILLLLRKIINQEESRVVVRVSSAKRLTDGARTHLKHFFRKYYSAKEVVLIESLDEKLLGGLKMRVNDEVFDLSIENKIRKLEAYLTKPA